MPTPDQGPLALQTQSTPRKMVAVGPPRRFANPDVEQQPAMTVFCYVHWQDGDHRLGHRENYRHYWTHGEALAAFHV